MNDAAPAEPSLRRAYITLGVTGMASFQTAMALSIIFVVFPDLEDSFPDASQSQLSWVVNSFTIFGAATLVLGSAVGERWGRKRTLLAGTIGFGAASILAAVAPDPGVIILARILQGVASALVLPMAASIVIAAFPIERRGQAIGLWGAIGAVAAATGPALGGLLIDIGNWRWAFWLNVPIATAAAIAGAIVLEESRGNVDRRLPDPIGALALLGGVGLFVLGLVQSNEWGWADPRTVGCLVVGLALIWYLVVRSLHHPAPVLDVELYKFRSFRIGNANMLVFGMSFFALLFTSILFLTDEWGYSIADAGLLTTPLFLTTGAMTMIAGRLSDRIGARAVTIPGGALWALGMLALWLGLDGADRNVGLWMGATTVAGIGSGLMWGGLFAITIKDLPTNRLSAGASVNQTLQRVGNALAVALAVTLLAGDQFARPFAMIAATGLLATVIALMR